MSRQNLAEKKKRRRGRIGGRVHVIVEEGIDNKDRDLKCKKKLTRGRGCKERKKKQKRTFEAWGRWVGTEVNHTHQEAEGKREVRSEYSLP